MQGTLHAVGTAQQPIVLTGLEDDAVGGDTNNDGPPPAGAPRFWKGLEFQSTSRSNELDHVDIRNASYPYQESAGAAVLLDGGELRMTNSVIRNCGESMLDAALRIVGANPTLIGSAFLNNTGRALSMDLASQPTIRGITLAGNAYNGVVLDGGTLPGDAVWDDTDIVYVLGGDVIVPAGRSLSISPGMVIKASRLANLVIDGTLNASGTAQQPIVFTASNDDTVGGNTDEKAVGSGGTWEGIRFNATSSGSRLEHTELRSVGDLQHWGSAIQIDHAAVTLSDTLIRNSAGGVSMVGGSPTLTNVTMRYNGAALSADLTAQPELNGMVFENNGLNGLALAGGTLAGDTSWDNPGVVYRLDDDVTVPPGVTLTVGAGQVIKFRHGEDVDLNVEGRLLAIGTLAQPIVFTSDTDNSAGGLTANDPDATPDYDDWGTIRFANTSTGDVLDYVDVRGGGYLEDGMVLVDGGELSVADSVLYNSSDVNLRVQNGGQASVRNSLLVWGYENLSVASGGQLVAVNDTLFGGSYGAVADGGTLALTNNLITYYTSGGVRAESNATIDMRYNDVWTDAPGVPAYEGWPDQTGQSGNFSADPRFFNPEAQQFQLRAGSPAIDRGTSDGVPDTDWLGSPRYDEPATPNLGGGAAPYYDVGALERQENNPSSADLKIVSVNGPTSGVQDQEVTVTWTVENAGTWITGSWQDALYLSPDPLWSSDDVVLKEVPHQASLGAGQTYVATVSVALPGVLPGEYYLMARTDSGNAIFEGANEANNAGVTAQTIVIHLPNLAFDTPAQGQLAGAGDSMLFQLTAPAGADVVFDLHGPDGVVTELYVRYGDVPSRQAFDYRGNRPNSADQSISFGNSREGTYYVLVYAADAAGFVDFTLTARQAGFGITGVTPSQGSNQGPVTIAVAGAQFDEGSTVKLIDSAGSPLDPATVYFTDSGLLSATFDLTGRPLGPADVQVIKSDAATTTLADAFQIVTGTPGRLVTNLIVPSGARVGRDYAIAIEYANEGDTDLLAPVMRLATQGFTTLGFTPNLASAEVVASLDLVGVAPLAPAGILAPGSQNRITLYGRAVSVGDEQFQLLAGQYAMPAIDWPTLQTTLRPPGLSDADWAAIWAQVAQRVGATWQSYQQAVADAATLLPPSRGPNYSLDSVFQLIVDQATAEAFPSVRGRVVSADTHQPLPDVTLVLYDAANGVVFNGTSLNDGTFFVPAVAPGTYETGCPGYVLVGDSTLVMPAAGSLEKLTFEVAIGATITGSVRGMLSGMPLRDVVVYAAGQNGGVYVATTNDDGSYALTGLAADVYEVSAGGAPFTRSVASGVAISAGEMRAHLDFTLATGGTIEGVVTGPQGPVADATVAAWGADGTVGVVVSGDAGTFSLGELAAQTYTLTAEAPGLYSLRSTEIPIATGGTVSGLSLTLLPAGSLTGTVTSAVDGSAVPYLIVSIEGDQGTFSTQSDSTGHIPAQDLPPGTYTVMPAGLARISHHPASARPPDLS